MTHALVLIAGFVSGACFYAWWVYPDLSNQKRRIAELTAQRDRLSHELLRAKNFTATKSSRAKNKDV